MSQRETLLRELASCRRYLMSQLADLAEERDNYDEARAWRWMRDHNKFPRETRKKTKTTYTWQVTGSDPFDYAEDQRHSPVVVGSPTVLPRVLYQFGYISTGSYLTAEAALEAAVVALTKFFKFEGQFRWSEGDEDRFVCPHCHDEDAFPRKEGRGFWCSECGARLTPSQLRQRNLEK